MKPSGWRVTRIWRIDLSATAGPEQPPVWTAIEFEADDDQADALAEAFARSLKREGGWYADFRLGDEPRVGDGNGPGCDHSRAAREWTAGQAFVQRASLPISGEAKPGFYPLVVGVANAAGGGFLTPHTGLPVNGGLARIGELEIRAP